jgi:hydroxymethylpyrimidine/phosphomethylpyrimidine kinase
VSDERERPIVLTIGACDTGAEEGVLADLRRFAALGSEGRAVVTRIRAQRARGAPRIHQVPPGFVATQIDAVIDSGRIAAVKTGALGNWQMVAAVAERARRRRLTPLVVDPQMADAGGERQLGKEGAELLRRKLLPLARVVTPTVAELEWLTGRTARDPEALRAAATALAQTGVGAVLVVGCGAGQAHGMPLLLRDETGAFREFLLALSPREGACSVTDRLSAVMAARLALGEELAEALENAVARGDEGVSTEENEKTIGKC